MSDTSAFASNAANASDGSIEVSSSNAEFKGKTVTAYQMFTYDKEAVKTALLPTVAMH